MYTSVDVDVDVSCVVVREMDGSAHRFAVSD